jgi:predicted PurR-regulated permease PerM
VIRQQNLVLVSAIVIIVALFYLLKPILAPFLIAALLAYLGDPWVNRLMHWKLPRTLAALVVFVIIISAVLLLLFLLIPLLGRQTAVFFAQLPAMVNWLQQSALPWINQYFHLNTSSDLQSVKTILTTHWQQAGNVALTVWQTLSRSSLAVVAWLAKALLLPVVTFYLLRDWDVVVAKITELLPPRFAPRVITIVGECDGVLSAFLRGQLWVMLSMAVVYSVGLSLVGLSTALLLGVIAGLLTIVPYLGLTIGIVSASIVALIQFHDWLHVLYVLIVFGVAHIIESMVLIPWLVGDRIGLHPVAVIFALLVGGDLFGFIGVLLALPVAAIVMVLLRHLKQQYVQSQIYQ